MTSELMELAARCEQASGPDRELDAAISTIIDGDDWSGTNPHWMSDEELPRYTASLDAAMTMMDNYGVLLHLSDIGADGLPLCNIGDSVTAREFKGVGTANLALAVCAAALRARATGGDRG